MKTSHTLYSRLTLITCISLTLGYFVVSAAWTAIGSVTSGDRMTANLWNNLVGNVNYLSGSLNGNNLGTLTDGKWCTANGTTISCTTEAPVSGGTSLWNTGASDSINYTAGKVKVGSVLGNAELQIQSGNNPHWGIYQNEASESLHFWNTDNRLTLTNDGNVGIGTPSPLGTIGFPAPTSSIFWPTTPSQANSRAWQIIGEQGVYGKMEIRSSDANDNTVDRTVMTFNKDGNVGIGTPTPVAKLDIKNSWVGATVLNLIESDNGKLFEFKEGAGWNAWMSVYDNSDNENIRLNTGGNSWLNAISGNVGIGTIDTGWYKLHVNGNAYTSGSWQSASDIRWKKNITSLTGSLNKIEQLRWVSFDWKREEYKDMNFDAETQIWFIAQEVEKIFPELVKTGDDGYKSVSYDKFSAVLIEAVKELKKENDSLKALVCLDHPTAEICK